MAVDGADAAAVGVVNIGPRGVVQVEPQIGTADGLLVAVGGSPPAALLLLLLLLPGEDNVEPLSSYDLPSVIVPALELPRRLSIHIESLCQELLVERIENVVSLGLAVSPPGALRTFWVALRLSG